MESSTSENKKIRETVIARVSHYTGIAEEYIREDQDLKDDLGVDSITLWEILTALEVDFGITENVGYTEVSDEDFDSIMTVEDIITYAERILKK